MHEPDGFCHSSIDGFSRGTLCAWGRTRSAVHISDAEQGVTPPGTTSGAEMARLGEALGVSKHFGTSDKEAECATRMTMPRLSIQAGRLQVVKAVNDLLSDIDTLPTEKCNSRLPKEEGMSCICARMPFQAWICSALKHLPARACKIAKRCVPACLLVG